MEKRKKERNEKEVQMEDMKKEKIKKPLELKM